MDILTLWSFVILLLCFCERTNSQTVLTNETVAIIKCNQNANTSNIDNCINIQLPLIWNVEGPVWIAQIEGQISFDVYKFNTTVYNNTNANELPKDTPLVITNMALNKTDTPLSTTKPLLRISNTTLVMTKRPSRIASASLMTKNTPTRNTTTPKSTNMFVMDINKKTKLHKNNDVCRMTGRPKSNVVMLILISDVKFNDIRYRNTVRRTWGSHNRTDVRIVFYLRMMDGDVLTPQIKNEINKYRDIVYIYQPHNQLQMLTSLLALNWIKEDCNNAKYLMKITTNVCVNIPLLMRSLNAFNDDNTIWGDVIEDKILKPHKGILSYIFKSKFSSHKNTLFNYNYCNNYGFLIKVKALEKLILFNINKHYYTTSGDIFMNDDEEFLDNKFITTSRIPNNIIKKVSDKRFYIRANRNKKTFFYLNSSS